MTDSEIRQTPWVVFPDADKSDERMAAILVSKDEEGTLKAHVVVPEDRAEIPEGVVDMVVNAVEIANL